MAGPAISILLPVYNAQSFLRLTIESLLNQTFKDFEMICVDDGSTDSSAEIMNDFADD